jgi:hypothetical protein
MGSSFTRVLSYPSVYSSNLSLLTTPVTNPTPRPAWPNPRAAARPVELLTWLGQRSLGIATAAAADPFRQRDWPTPVGARASNVTWLQNGFAVLTPQVTRPFVQSEWQNPAGKPVGTWLHKYEDHYSVFDIPLLAQTDWPVPKGYSRSVDLLTWTQSNTVWLTFVPPNKPLNQTNWPNPTRAVNRVPYSVTFTPVPSQIPAPPAVVKHLGPLFWSHAPGFDDGVERRRQERRAEKRRAREAEEAYKLRLILERLFAGLPANEEDDQTVLSPPPAFRLQEFVEKLGAFADTPMKLEIQRQIQEMLAEEDDIEFIMMTV